MPKAQNIEDKYINNIKVDKEDDTCFFNDETHTYYNKNDMTKYISVTQIISQYCEEFNEEFWSAYKALEALMDAETFFILKKSLLATKKFDDRYLSKFGIDKTVFLEKQQEIKNTYDKNRNESCERGTAIHLSKELSFYNKQRHDFSKFGYESINGEYECKENYYQLNLARGVYPEFLISVTSSDKILRVAGQIDLLIKDGNDIYIVDWKSNKKIEKTSYYDKSKKQHKMMKFPLNNLQDSTFNHYQLQLSLYAYMLQTLHPEFNIKGLCIYHIDHDNNETKIPVEYLKEDVIRMLKHYKKQLKIQSELTKIKPIEYV